MAETVSLSRPHGDRPLGFSAQCLCVTKPSFQSWAPGVRPGNLVGFVGFPFSFQQGRQGCSEGTLGDRQAAPPTWAGEARLPSCALPKLGFLDRWHEKTDEELWPTPESTHDPGSPLTAVWL